jgi:hypothetical protein
LKNLLKKSSITLSLKAFQKHEGEAGRNFNEFAGIPHPLTEWGWIGGQG